MEVAFPVVNTVASDFPDDIYGLLETVASAAGLPIPLLGMSPSVISRYGRLSVADAGIQKVCRLLILFYRYMLSSGPYLRSFKFLARRGLSCVLHALCAP